MPPTSADSFLDDGVPTPVTLFLLVHHGLRRDLARFREVLSRGHVDAVAIRDHWALFREILETHHRAEDDVLFPALRAARPDLAATLDALDADHGRLEGLLDGVEHALAPGPADSARTVDTNTALAAVTDLAMVLDAHLAAEEDRLVPAMRELPPGSGPPPGGGFAPEISVPWSVDGVHPDVVEALRARLPAGAPGDVDAWLGAWDLRRRRTWGEVRIGSATRARPAELVAGPPAASVPAGPG